MEKRPRRTPAEKARAQYTNYAVKEPHGTNGVSGCVKCRMQVAQIEVVVEQTGGVGR